MKIDSILNLEIAYLKSNGIKEVGYTKLTCIGYGFHSTTYLFWKKENSTFIQKFENSEYDDDSLKKFKPLEITDTLFFNFYRQNKEKLNEETIEHFEYKPDSIVGNITYSSTIMASHSCFRYFIIKSNDENFHKQFDYFDLKEFDKKKRYTSKRKYTEEERRKWQKRDLEISEYEIVHENYPKRNLNFKKNKSLKIVKWDEIMTEYIEKLESENKFKLINIE